MNGRCKTGMRIKSGYTITMQRSKRTGESDGFAFASVEKIRLILRNSGQLRGKRSKRLCQLACIALLLGGQPRFKTALITALFGLLGNDTIMRAARRTTPSLNTEIITKCEFLS